VLNIIEFPLDFVPNLQSLYRYNLDLPDVQSNHIAVKKASIWTPHVTSFSNRCLIRQQTFPSAYACISLSFGNRISRHWVNASAGDMELSFGEAYSFPSAEQRSPAPWRPAFLFLWGHEL